ncbi:hypothetical protein [Flexivirga oryzae]|uniref:DUF2213 domain-containing protein n=1 Tax=Flexivirga oryzae TaxID=1794944 RepID=A0A839N452_9MICO|nr:hypothetical protein [Flexivirga oryzae]MBB2892087.1 hypothetical protein [Flexivirga oryzae]
MVNLSETQRHGVNLLVHVEFVPRDLLSAPQQWLDVQLDARDQRAQNQYQRNLHLVGDPNDPDVADTGLRGITGCDYPLETLERIREICGDDVRTTPGRDEDGGALYGPGSVFGVKADLVPAADGEGLVIDPRTLQRSDFTIDEHVLDGQLHSMNEADYRLRKYEAMDELGDQIQREHFAGVTAAVESESDHHHSGDIAEEVPLFDHRADVVATVRVDAAGQAHADIPSHDGVVLDANVSQVADALASTEDKARSLVLEAAQELTHGWPVQWHADSTEVPENDTVASQEASRPLRSAPTAQLAERTVLALANTEHYLDTAAHYLEGAGRGLAHRQEDLAPDVIDGWSATVHDSIVQLVNCHLNTLEDASTNLDRADAHLRDAMALAQSPHLTAENHDRAIGTLTDTIEVTVAVEKARAPLKAAVALLRRDPSSVDQIGAAREQIGLALPHLNHARDHAASADWSPAADRSQAPSPSSRARRPDAPARGTSVSRGMVR